MNTEKVISREYKIVLSIEKFIGNEKKIKKESRIFWSAFKKATRLLIKAVDGNLNIISATREIRFYDTKDLQLYLNNYIFRERKSLTDNDREVTLKFRHPDRYISQDRDMKPKINGKKKVKFEEDIKAPFVKLYSFSGSIEIPHKKKMRKLKDIIEAFPDLEESLDRPVETKLLQLVNGLEVKEIVITGGRLRLNDKPGTFAECALIIWYDMKNNSTNPIICEFSFRYGSKKEKYNKETAQCAYNLFLLVQEKMKEWIDTEGNSKTSFVYNS